MDNASSGWTRFGLLLLSCASLAPVAVAGKSSPLKTGVPVNVREVANVAREAEPVTFAFPFGKKDKIKNPSVLRVLDGNGNAVPAQFRVTQRWKNGPYDPKQPIRWLLVDLQVDVAAGGTAQYFLQKKPKTKKGDPPPEEPEAPTLDVVEDEGAIHIDTGTAKFRISKTVMNFLDLLAADLDGDGLVEDEEKLIDSPSGAGFILMDRMGDFYSSAEYPVEVQIEEQGPLRTVIRCDGRHAPMVSGGGIDRDFFKYRTRYTFYAGKPYVRVQHSLRNSYLDDPLGNIGFEGYGLMTAIAPGANAGGPAFTTSYGIEGTTPFDVTGPSLLYQDSHGGDNWASGANTTFKGFHVDDTMGHLLRTGNQAFGSMTIKSGSVGLTFFVKDFWENYPKGLGFDGTTLQVGILPAEFASFHWLDDGQQKTTEFYVCAHGPNGPDVDTLMKKLDKPLHPWTDPAWLRTTKAWADLGDLDAPVESDASISAYDDNALAALYTNAFQDTSYTFGWSEFGEFNWAKSTHTTGSPRNALTYFDRFAIAGSWSHFRIKEIFVTHSRDIRTYHIDGFSREAKPNATLWEALPVWPFSKDFLGRDSLDATLDPHRAGIPEKGHGWNAFDMEHFVVDDLYEYYILTGDWICLDSLAEIGECVRTWPIYSTTKAPGSTRGTGWTMRGLTKIWQVTGDQRFLDSANDLVLSVEKTRGQKPSPITGKVYHYITRYPPHNNHIKDAEYDLAWQMAVVVHGMSLHNAETGSKMSKKIAADVAGYIVDYSWDTELLTMDEAIAVDDHNNDNPKPDNTGVNTWIPSALAVAYRANPKNKAWLDVATVMYDSLPAFHSANGYLGYTTFSWWHGYKTVLFEVQQKQKK